MIAEVRAAEAQVEELRIRQLDAERARSAAAQRMEDVRARLATWERDLAVAEERAVYASGVSRRSGWSERKRASGPSGSPSKRARSRRTESGSRPSCARSGTRSPSRSSARTTCGAGSPAPREALDAVEGRERDIARRGAQLEGDALAADAQAAELGRRLERLAAELEEASHQLTDLESQGDLFTDRLQQLAHGVEAGSRAVAAARDAVDAARAAADAARTGEMAAADAASRLEAQRGALERMERDREGVEPVVRAALARGHDGVLGVLVDFVRAPEGLAGAVEAYLGALARALVVRDLGAAERMRRWFERRMGRGRRAAAPAARPRAVRGRGHAAHVDRGRGRRSPVGASAPGDVDLVEDDALLVGDGPRLARSGAARDARGVVRLGNPAGASGVLERRERLRALGAEAQEARAEAERTRGGREAAASAVNEAEDRLERARATLREAEDDLRRADAEAAAQVDRKARMDRHRDELARQVEGTRAARARAEERAQLAREDRQSLDAEEIALREQRAEDAPVARRRARRSGRRRAPRSRVWRSRRRASEGELSRARERLEATTASRGAALERVESLDREECSLREEMDRVERLRAEGAAATQQLFRERDEAAAELRGRDAALAEVAESLEVAERRARARRARPSARRRTGCTRLELERQETSARVDRIRDRLEGEWGRPLEKLMQEASPVDGDPELLQEELRQIVIGIERIGPVNMLAVEEHEEESKRLDFCPRSATTWSPRVTTCAPRSATSTRPRPSCSRRPSSRSARTSARCTIVCSRAARRTSGSPRARTRSRLRSRSTRRRAARRRSASTCSRAARARAHRAVAPLRDLPGQAEPVLRAGRGRRARSTRTTSGGSSGS
jgi:chromosome segregation protein